MSSQSPATTQLATEELERLARRAANGDAHARAAVVERSFPRLSRWAGRYAGRGVSRDDLLQDAAVGLLRALERFDPTRGVPFLAWADIWIRQSLQQAIAEQSRPVRLTRHVLWDIHELKSRYDTLHRPDGREPALIDVADSLGWPVERVATTLMLAQEPEAPNALDLVGDPLSEAAYYDVLTRLTAAQLRPLLLRLSDRERHVLERRAAGASLRDVGRELGVSGERVRALEERGLAKVRAAAEADQPDAAPAYVTP
jgi:RNA polymerase sigma factor (sigma-70 family)